MEAALSVPVRLQRVTESPERITEVLAGTRDGRPGSARVAEQLYARGTALGE